MIRAQEFLELYDKPLFTKLEFDTPFDGALPISSEACYAYVFDGDKHYVDKQNRIIAAKGHAIMSLCGLTMGNVLAHQEVGRISTIVLQFHPEHLKKLYKDSKPEFWEELNKPVTDFIVQSAANSLVKSYFNGILDLFNNRNAISESFLILKFKEIILLLLKTEDSPRITNMVRSLFSERTFTFQEIIDAYLFEPLTLDNLAQLTNCSLSTFKRQFKKIYNDSPGKYIITKRLEKVAQQLLLSDEPINQIAYSCGFSTVAHLNKCFKEKYHVPPSQYRLTRTEK